MRIFFQILACLVFPAGLAAQTMPKADRSDYVYELMSDRAEERKLDKTEFETVVPKGDKILPVLSEPFNITSDYIKSYPDAQASDGIQMITLPNSNSRGACELELPLLLPPVRHQMKPNLLLKYNSDIWTGNVARGWNIDFPKITMDTLRSTGVSTRYQWNGNPLVSVSENNEKNEYATIQKGTRISVYQDVVDPGSNISFWYLTDSEGVKHTFGVINAKSAEEDSIVAVTKVGEDHKIVEWYETFSENQYGDYVRYIYNPKNTLLDSIYIGRKEYKYPIIKMVVTWEWKQRTDSIKGYGEIIESKNRIAKIEELYLKDFSSADNIPNKDQELYDIVRTYGFDSYIRPINLLDRITVSHVKGALPYSYVFEYYNEKDSIAHYKAFRDTFYNLVSDSLIIDRTGLLKTIHTPLGACASIDYDYVNIPLCHRDSVVVFEANTDTLLRYRQDRDTLLHSYFHRKDSVARKYVMKSLWVSDAVKLDGRPSKNYFKYGKPYVDSEDRFVGFSSVLTTNLNTAADTFIPYRYIEKKYDTTSCKTLSNIISVQVSDTNSQLLLEDTYKYKLVDPYLDSLFFELAQRTHLIDGQSEKWDYTYITKGNHYCLSELNHYTEDHLDKTISYEYDNQGKEKEVSLNGGDKVLLKTQYKYADMQNPQLPTSMIQQVSEEESIITDYKYDKDGNMVERIQRGAKDMKYRYLYDRRLNLFVERVEDSHNYRTEYGDYDYFYGRVGKVVDMNGQVLIQKYDAMGRMDTVIAPIEVERGEKYTIAYVYSSLSSSQKIDSLSSVVVRDSIVLNIPESIYMGNIIDSIPDSVKINIISNLFGAEKDVKEYNFCEGIGWEGFDTFNIVVDTGRIEIPSCHCNDIIPPHLAQTIRFNALYKGIEKGQHFSTYSDGFGRPIQRQEEMEIFHPESLNDKVKVERTYIASAINYYDPYGRKSIQSQRYNVGKITQYIDPARGFQGRMDYEYDELNRLVSVSGPKGDVKTYTYQNGHVGFSNAGVSGNAVYTIDGKMLSCNVPVYQERIYDALGRLTLKKDGPVVETYEYDMLGRVVRKTNNQHGVISMTYDHLGNMTGMQNEDSITYVYDGKLLTDILYSKYKTNNVHFVYGDVNAPYKRVGRVALVTDASGVREFNYGCQGEVTKDVRTFILPDSTIETFRSSYVYDTWNRLGKHIYPDQEILTYTYNINGLADNVTGNKSYSYQYVMDATYDEYGQNTYYKSCNGAETRRIYSYPELGMRMMSVYDKLNHSIFEMQKNGNVVQINTDSLSMNKNIQIESDNKKLMEEGRIDAGDDSAIFNNEILFDEHFQKSETNRTSSGLITPYDHEGNNKWSYRYTENGLLASVVGDEKDGRVSAILRSYDSKGNQTREVWTLNLDEYELEGGQVFSGLNTKMFAYDDNDQLSALSDNGYITTYWYDAMGDRALVSDGGQFSIYVNSIEAGKASYQPNYTLYINRHFEKNSAGVYTKHVWLGDERVASKEGNMDSYGSNPAMIERAGANVDGIKVNYDSLLRAAIQGMELRYESVEACYTANTSGYKTYTSKNANVDYGNDHYEDKQLYYHTDKENNALVVTDLKLNTVEQAFFSKNGEILHLGFKEGYYTPYMFKGFSFDRVTGFYNKGRLYVNPWLNNVMCEP